MIYAGDTQHETKEVNVVYFIGQKRCSGTEKWCVCVCSAVKSESGTSTPRLNHSWTTSVELYADWNWTNQRSGPEYYSNLATDCGTDTERNYFGTIRWKYFLLGVCLENSPVHVRLISHTSAWHVEDFVIWLPWVSMEIRMTYFCLCYVTHNSERRKLLFLFASPTSTPLHLIPLYSHSNPSDSDSHAWRLFQLSFLTATSRTTTTHTGSEWTRCMPLIW